MASRRKSLLWPTVVAAAALVLLLGLGTWQVQRLHWKEGLIGARQRAVSAPSVDLPSSPEEARGLEFHAVQMRGQFLNDRELYLLATGPNGAAGVHVVTPLRLGRGGIVLVDRGFVPDALRDPASRAAGEIAGETDIAGLLRLPYDGKPGWFTPDNDPQHNQWFYVDIPTMAAAGGLQGVLPFYVDAGPAPNPGGYPLGGQTPLELPNDHLQYALTWYALALGLAVVYIAVLRRNWTAGEHP